MMTHLTYIIKHLWSYYKQNFARKYRAAKKNLIRFIWESNSVLAFLPTVWVSDPDWDLVSSKNFSAVWMSKIKRFGWIRFRYWFHVIYLVLEFLICLLTLPQLPNPNLFSSITMVVLYMFSLYLQIYQHHLSPNRLQVMHISQCLHISRFKIKHNNFFDRVFTKNTINWCII